jgi:hypothetical protein
MELLLFEDNIKVDGAETGHEECKLDTTVIYLAAVRQPASQ